MPHLVRTTTLRSIVSAVVLGLLGGCTTFPISRLPDPGERAATVTVVRNRSWSGGLLTHYISVDGAGVVKLGNDEYTTFRVSEGTHQIAVQWKPPLWGPYTNSVQIEAQPGRRYLVATEGVIPRRKDMSDAVAILGVYEGPDERWLQGKTLVPAGAGPGSP